MRYENKFEKESLIFADLANQFRPLCQKFYEERSRTSGQELIDKYLYLLSLPTNSEWSPYYEKLFSINLIRIITNEI